MIGKNDLNLIDIKFITINYIFERPFDLGEWFRFKEKIEEKL